MLSVCHRLTSPQMSSSADLLQFASAKPQAMSRYSPPTAVPSSVPNPVSSLTASRPSLAVNNVAAAGSSQKARRMSSSTQGALARGKLGLTGEPASVKERCVPPL